LAVELCVHIVNSNTSDMANTMQKRKLGKSGLKVEAIDLFYQHRVDTTVPIENAAANIAIQGERYPEELERRTGN